MSNHTCLSVSRQDLANHSKDELLDIIENLQSLITNIPPLSEAEHDTPATGRYRQRYAQQILDSIPDMLTVLDDKGVFVDLISSEETNHVGLSSDQITGIDIKTFLPEEAYQRVIENLHNVVKTQQGATSTHILFENGHPHYYENRIFPLEQNHNLCICRDVTDATIARQELELMKYAVNNASETIFAAAEDGRIIFANEQFLIDHKVKSYESKYVFDMSFGINSPQIWHDIVADITQNNGKTTYTNREVQHPSGEHLTFDLEANLVIDHNGDKTYWFFARDITTRVRQDRKILELNYIMEAILNNIPVYLSVKNVDDNFKYIYWNREFEKQSGIPASKALGHTDFEIFPNHRDAERFRKNDLELVKNGDPMEYFEDYMAADGTLRTIKTLKLLIPDGKNMTFMMGVSWDITDLKNAERTLIASKMAVEQSNRLQMAFLANMSHEIRTPLNAIVGFSKLMSSIEEPEEKQQYSDIIDSNSELLLQLINDILNLSQIEAGTLEFVIRPMNLVDLCRTVYEVQRNRLLEGVTLELDCEHSELNMYCDQNRLMQVITNLLTNAIKFTSHGQIRFGFMVDGNRINFFVRDTGTGIPADKLNSVFERFVKLNKFAQGTGLGLSISQMIIERFGGEISATSTEGVGTEFRFWIPYEPVHNMSEAEQE